MNRLFGQVLNIRRGEFAVTLLMFLYYYLILVTYYFLKPARDTLFLTQLGSNQLPVVFILIAVIVAPIASLYSRAGQSMKLNRLITITTVILIISLFVLRLLIQLGDSWVFYTFYIWVSIYGILTTSQYWLFANVIYSPTQAKRLFVLLTLGGILGAFTGGEITSLMVTKFSVTTENLLFICSGFLAVCALLSNVIWKLALKEAEDTSIASTRIKRQPYGMRDTFTTISRSRHLMIIVGVISLSMIITSFVDYQFKTVTVDHFREKVKNEISEISLDNPGLTGEELADMEISKSKSYMSSFFGQFYGRLSLVSLFLQIA